MIVERHYGDLPLLCGLILDDMSPYFSGSKLVVGDLSEGICNKTGNFGLDESDSLFKLGSSTEILRIRRMQLQDVVQFMGY
ncbi:predicted protein [Botrytis cinerea T4]|uniref:Uncharacterized protein n=1 Tax=Botryotinia fuckeliana (strain T4) TaxID=999810 RepID=G2YPJ7_BOTF4|nr:predicted protein [Botrytis cinerea T4]